MNAPSSTLAAFSAETGTSRRGEPAAWIWPRAQFRTPYPTGRPPPTPTLNFSLSVRSEELSNANRIYDTQPRNSEHSEGMRPRHRRPPVERHRG